MRAMVTIFSNAKGPPSVHRSAFAAKMRRMTERGSKPGTSAQCSPCCQGGRSPTAGPAGRFSPRGFGTRMGVLVRKSYRVQQAVVCASRGKGLASALLPTSPSLSPGSQKHPQARP
jgi:hypothetical protein